MRSLNIPQTSPNAPEPVVQTDDPYDIDGMSVDELIQLRQEVDKRLPIRSLKDINMEQELLLQLLTAQQLQRDVLADEEIPANQRAQTMNSVAASLQVLAKLQVEVHTSERLKRIENILVEAVTNLPNDVQVQFFDQYEALLGQK